MIVEDLARDTTGTQLKQEVFSNKGNAELKTIFSPVSIYAADSLLIISFPRCLLCPGTLFTERLQRQVL